jgi:hypothetical protein
MNWMIWTLIILGAVWDWDAAHSITLQNEKRCIVVKPAERDYYLVVSECVAGGSDGQTWLWEGKRLKNKLSGTCIGVAVDKDYGLYDCSLAEVPGAPKKHYRVHKEYTEFTRFGQHGLKNSKGKCIKFPQGIRADGMRLIANCTEDKLDPYYE